MIVSLIQSTCARGSTGLECILPALHQGLQLVSCYATKATPPYLKDAKASKKTRKIDDKPPRAVSAYAFYVKEQAPLRMGAGTKVSEILKQLGPEWKTLSDSQKQPYLKLAQESKAAAASAREAAKQAKAPPSAYNIWCREITQELRARDPSLKATDMMKEAAARWRSLPDGEKQRRKAEASAARAEWKQQQEV